MERPACLTSPPMLMRAHLAQVGQTQCAAYAIAPHECHAHENASLTRILIRVFPHILTTNT